MKISPNICLLFIIILYGCAEYTPRPKAYPKITFPERGNKTQTPACPFSLDIPIYSTFKNIDDPDNSCWYNVDYTPFNATLHLSYIPIEGPGDLDSLTEDAYRMVFKPHLQRAEEIIEREINDPVKNLTGMIYDLEGKTATPLNFFISDGKSHFLRGSFYFNAKTNRDSILPIYNFINKDIMRTIESIQFKNRTLFHT